MISSIGQTASDDHPSDTNRSSNNDNSSASGINNNTNTTTATGSTGSLYEQYMNAISKLESEPQTALLLLQQVQEQITTHSYFSSSSSETLDDVTTSLLPYLAIEYQFGMCYMNLPMQSQNIRQRKCNLYVACEYFHKYLNRLQNYDILTKDEMKLYEHLLELTDHVQGNNSNDDDQQHQEGQQQIPQFTTSNIMNRETKISQFKQMQELQQEYDKLQSLQLRRKRILNSTSDDDTSDTTMLDGYDSDSLLRTKYTTYLHMMKLNTFNEWYSILQELPMISMMIQQQQHHQMIYKCGNIGCNMDHRLSSRQRQQQQQQQKQQHHNQSKQPLQLTQITQDAITGQLRIQRQDIQRQIYQPGWNQPTKSLDDFAQEELDDALRRQQQQELNEINDRANPTPRRYEQLVKDGLEDNIDLVDASAQLDEQWDRFKDDNKRGSGNKRGDVGDRNF